jgi:caffeoyl-CoA O-methyltransferase
MAFIVESRVEDYAIAASSPHPLDGLFERLAVETRERTSAPQMMVGPLEGRFLELLVRLTGARRVLELGTFTGRSSMAMASALPPGGTVVTCDVDPEAQEIARRYAEEAGVADRIDYRSARASRRCEASTARSTSCSSTPTRRATSTTTRRRCRCSPTTA